MISDFSQAVPTPEAQDCRQCLPVCDNPFDRVVISYLLHGGTHVAWELKTTFLDKMPYTFTLEVGQSQNDEADDWETVGSPVRDAFYAVDIDQRIYGKLRYQFYRVKLETTQGTYYSAPTGLEGTLSRRDWRLAANRVRQERLRMRMFAGQMGYLLKRRITGTPCPVCLDHITQEVKDPHCPTCFGTGFYCGYFFPMACVWADIDPKKYHVHLDGTRGTVNDIVVRARMLNTWLMAEDDVWVNKVTDDRYYVHSVNNVADTRGVPLVATVELRAAPASDPIFSIEIPDQLLAITYDNHTGKVF